MSDGAPWRSPERYRIKVHDVDRSFLLFATAVLNSEWNPTSLSIYASYRNPRTLADPPQKTRTAWWRGRRAIQPTYSYVWIRHKRYVYVLAGNTVMKEETAVTS